jgi:hypothetical protein
VRKFPNEFAKLTLVKGEEVTEDLAFTQKPLQLLAVYTPLFHHKICDLLMLVNIVNTLRANLGSLFKCHPEHEPKVDRRKECCNQ